MSTNSLHLIYCPTYSHLTGKTTKMISWMHDSDIYRCLNILHLTSHVTV